MVKSKQYDIRWIQRLSNFKPAFEQLKHAVELAQSRELSDLEKQGLIQAFEFTHELAWNVFKDYFEHQGANELITGSRDATGNAFQRGIIQNGDAWMGMITSRNQTSHTYNRAVADEIAGKILTKYFAEFEKFEATMNELAKK